MQSSDTIWEQEQHKDDSDDADGDDDAVDVTLLLLPAAVDDHDDGLDVMMSFLWSMIICHRCIYNHVYIYRERNTVCM